MVDHGRCILGGGGHFSTGDHISDSLYAAGYTLYVAGNGRQDYRECAITAVWVGPRCEEVQLFYEITKTFLRDHKNAKPILCCNFEVGKVFSAFSNV